MNSPILIEQDGRVLRVKFNRTQDNGVSDSMAGVLARERPPRTRGLSFRIV